MGDYVDSHKDTNNNIYFISNCYSESEYGHYADRDGSSSRGDPTVSFSPSGSNRYYVFQEPSPLYTHAYQIDENGSLNKVDGTNEPAEGNDSTTWETGSEGGAGWEGGIFAGVYESESTFETAYNNSNPKRTKTGDLWEITDNGGVTYTLPEGQTLTDCVVFLEDDLLDTIDKPGSAYADDYFFLLLDYYIPTDEVGKDIQGHEVSDTSGAVAVQRVVARKGSEFGSGLDLDKINKGGMLCWTDLNGNSDENSDYEFSSNDGGNPTEKTLFESVNNDLGNVPEELNEKIDGTETDATPWQKNNNDSKVDDTEFTDVHFAVAARPGGIRVGDMYQNRRYKTSETLETLDHDQLLVMNEKPAGNITETEATYYVPTIAENSGMGEEVIIDNYLGNNGRLAVNGNAEEPQKTEVTPGEGKYVNPGQEILYKISWQNNGDNNASVKITDTLDKRVDFMSAYYGYLDSQTQTYEPHKDIVKNDCILEANPETDEEPPTGSQTGAEKEPSEDADVQAVLGAESDVEPETSEETHETHAQTEESAAEEETDPEASNSAAEEPGAVGPSDDPADGQETPEEVKPEDSVGSLSEPETDYTFSADIIEPESEEEKLGPEPDGDEDADNEKKILINRGFFIEYGENTPLQLGTLLIAYEPGNRIVRWEFTNVPEGFSGDVFLTVRVNENALTGDHIIKNKAEVNNEPTDEVTNPVGEKGGLTVTKTVTGAAGDPQKEWHFRVELSDTSINGTYGDMTFTNGVAEFTLKHGESKNATSLPDGITYTVTEQEANQDGYTTHPTRETGTIPKDGIAEAEFVNSKPDSPPPPEEQDGNLKVTKTVTGNVSDTGKEWHFRVELSDKTINGTYGDMTFTNGVAEFTLKHDESKTATGLPDGVTYTVTEAEANQDGYTTTPSGETGTVPKNGTAEAKFKNDKPAGDLEVEKRVTGTGDKTKEWHFRVELSDTGINGTYGDMTFTNGVAEFTLKHGETKTATGLPAGVTYTVTELEANQDDYTTTEKGGSGTITAGGTANAKFVNNKPNEPEKPDKPYEPDEPEHNEPTDEPSGSTATIEPKPDNPDNPNDLSESPNPGGPNELGKPDEPSEQGNPSYSNEVIPPGGAPMMGDDRNLGLWCVLFVASLVGIVALIGILLISKRRKTKNKTRKR